MFPGDIDSYQGCFKIAYDLHLPPFFNGRKTEEDASHMLVTSCSYAGYILETYNANTPRYTNISQHTNSHFFVIQEYTFLHFVPTFLRPRHTFWRPMDIA
jgi:hypothetical protein